MNTRTCLACGWVHFGITRESAQDEVERFNAYYETLSAQEQQEYYGGKPSTIQSYEQCFGCGGPYTNFRPARVGDCPDGCTLQPIVFDW